MRVIGMYTAILVNPDDANDFFGNGNLKNADSTIIWFGPNARCVGPDGSTTAFSTGSIKTYRLVDENA